MLMFTFYMMLGNLSSDDLNANENVSLENVHLRCLSYLTHTLKHDLDLTLNSFKHLEVGMKVLLSTRLH